MRKNFALRKQLLFNKGTKKLIADMDCVTMLKSQRMVRLIASVLFS
jgi:hypothetical protein